MTELWPTDLGVVLEGITQVVDQLDNGGITKTQGWVTGEIITEGGQEAIDKCRANR